MNPNSTAHTSPHVKGHLVIYGWNLRYKALIKELRGEGVKVRRSVVIINIDSFDFSEFDGKIQVIPGGRNHGENLQRAQVDKAHSLLLSSALQEEGQGEALLLCLQARKLNPRLRILVDLPHREGAENFLNMGADEVLCGEQFCSMVTASTIINEGITQFYREILSTRFGNEFYTVSFSSHYVGMDFVTALEELKEKKNVLLLAVKRGRHIYTNPSMLTIEKGDGGIVLTESELEAL